MPSSDAAHVRYTGSFPLAWLKADEQVMSAGDGTGAAIIVSPHGERRVSIGDPIEPARTHVEHEFGGDGADCLICGEGRCHYLHGPDFERAMGYA